MDISVRAARLATIKTPLLGVPTLGPPAQDSFATVLDTASKGALLRIAREERYKGDSGQTLSVTLDGEVHASRVLLFGMSPDRRFHASQVRTFAHRIARVAREKGLPRFAIAVPDIDVPKEDLLRWLAEGAVSGVYRYDRFLTGDRKPRPEPKRCVLVLPKDGGKTVTATAAFKVAAAQGHEVGQSIMMSRDLVNAPANALTPEIFAGHARGVANERGLEIEVLGPNEIKDTGMGLLDAVGRGSTNPPRFVHLTHRPSKIESKQVVALVGKGVTFDSGGLSLKTSKGQMDMKCDMGGAALVLGAMDAIARTNLPIEVHGIIPMAENMPGGGAYRPGDVFTALNGKTVEVLNTDAEGRLILADALAFSTGLSPDVVIDFATLTGACMVALGPYRAGLWDTSDNWAGRFADAAERAGEPLWRMPLAKELRNGLKSQVADLRNIGGAWGGAITAALFLREFVGKTPWLHLDIAGAAYLDKPRAFYPKGGTGYGILTVLELLRSSLD